MIILIIPSPWVKCLKPPIMQKQQVNIDYNYFGNPQSVAGPIGLHIEINTIKELLKHPAKILYELLSMHFLIKCIF